MKYLLILLLLAVVIWRWRQASIVRHTQRTHTPTQAKTTKMVACQHCGVHLPVSEALCGREGHFYCSVQHRQLREH